MGCARLEAVTYPDPTVAALINQSFAPFRVNVREQPLLARQFAVAWTPMVVVLHPREIRLDEWTGYLPPSEFLPRLELALAKHETRGGQPEQGVQRLNRLLATYPSARCVPEALFWKGVMAYYRSGMNKEQLFAVWRDLAATYPDSEWAVKTTLLDWPESPYLVPPDR